MLNQISEQLWFQGGLARTLLGLNPFVEHYSDCLWYHVVYYLGKQSHIVMLSKEEQTVVSVCESLKKVSTETKTSVNTSNQSSPKSSLSLKGVHSTCELKAFHNNQVVQIHFSLNAVGRKKSSETLSPMSIVCKSLCA